MLHKHSKDFRMIFTSYFANIRNLPPNCIPISIAQFPPKGFVSQGGLEYKTLAPPKNLLRKVQQDHNHREYILSYKHEVLDKLDKNQVYQELLDMSNGQTVVLCCYEKPEKFCHRKIVQKWLGITEWCEDMSTENSLF